MHFPNIAMKTLELLFVCSAILTLAEGKKKKSEYTQKGENSKRIIVYTILNFTLKAKCS